LCRKLRTSQSPMTHVPVGYCGQYRRSCHSEESMTVTAATSCRTLTSQLSRRRAAGACGWQALDARRSAPACCSGRSYRGAWQWFDCSAVRLPTRRPGRGEQPRIWIYDIAVLGVGARDSPATTATPGQWRHNFRYMASLMAPFRPELVIIHTGAGRGMSRAGQGITTAPVQLWLAPVRVLRSRR
jgi:hypothetical protein